MLIKKIVHVENGKPVQDDFISELRIYSSITELMLCRSSSIFCDAIAQIGPRPYQVIIYISHETGHTHIYTRTQKHTHSRLLCMSDQPVSEAATCTTQNKHKRLRAMTSAGFEPVIPAIRRLQTYNLDCTATGDGLRLLVYNNFHSIAYSAVKFGLSTQFVRTVTERCDNTGELLEFIIKSWEKHPYVIW
jgi:hypothetical protein